MCQRVIAICICLLAVVGCTYEHPTDGQLLIDVADTPLSDDASAAGESGQGLADAFYADGLSHRTVTVSFTGGVTAGKPLTVTTSLGIINPAADAAAKRTLALKTTNGAAIEFELYAERTSGAGRITVEGPNGTRAVDDFLLHAVKDVLTITPSFGPHIADGGSRATLTISLTSQDRSFRSVTVTTSLGTLSPDKKEEAARTRIVRVSPAEPANVDWDLGTTPGVAVVTAVLDDAFEMTTVNLDPVPPSEVKLALKLGDGTKDATAADGQSTIPITVTYDAPPASTDSVTLTTTLGQLNPAGASEEARRTATVSVHGGKSSVVNLNVGRVAGQAVVSAHAVSASAVTKSMLLTPAVPERVAIEVTGGSVLDNVRKEASFTVRLARNVGNGRVSIGTAIQLIACCNDGDGIKECTKYLTVPDFAEDNDGDGRELSTVALTPTGRTFVETVSSTTNKDLSVTLHAFVLEAGSAPSDIGCADLSSDEPPDEVLARDSVELGVARKPLPTPTTP